MNSTKSNWIIANLKHSGFYRVNYDMDNWNALIATLNSVDFRLIDETSRSQLIDDSYNLGRAEYIEQPVFLRVISYLRNANNETTSDPYIVALTGINYIRDMMSLTSSSNSSTQDNLAARNLLSTFILSLYKNSYARLNWKNITADEALSDM
jgi:aminopeptidase N